MLTRPRHDGGHGAAKRCTLLPMSRQESSAIERLARRATEWTERWMPDAFVFALAATLVIVLAAFAFDPAARQAPLRVVDAWGAGFWTLIPFTLQMTMIIIGGYVLATSPPVFRLIARIAAAPRTAKGAVLVVALVAMASVAAQLGLQPDRRRRARARGRATGPGGRLPRARREQLPRARHGLGAGAERIGRAPDGARLVHAAEARADGRRDSADRHDLPLAEPRLRPRRDRRRRGGGVALRAERRARPHGPRSRDRSRAGRARAARRTARPGRVARAQPRAGAADRRARVRLSGPHDRPARDERVGAR